MKRLGKYAFDELGCARVTCRVASDNPWCEVLTRVGFTLEGRMRRGFDGATIDMMIFGVLKEEYRYGR